MATNRVRAGAPVGPDGAMWVAVDRASDVPSAGSPETRGPVGGAIGYVAVHIAGAAAEGDGIGLVERGAGVGGRGDEGARGAVAVMAVWDGVERNEPCIGTWVPLHLSRKTKYISIFRLSSSWMDRIILVGTGLHRDEIFGKAKEMLRRTGRKEDL
jgi:hypothetical protein